MPAHSLFCTSHSFPTKLGLSCLCVRRLKKVVPGALYLDSYKCYFLVLSVVWSNYTNHAKRSVRLGVAAASNWILYAYSQSYTIVHGAKCAFLLLNVSYSFPIL